MTTTTNEDLRRVGGSGSGDAGGAPGRRLSFFAGVWAGSAPLVLWAVHFAFCYVATAVGCTAILRGDGAALTQPQLRLLMAGGTVVALVAGTWLLLHACSAATREQGDLLPKVRLASALLALVGMLWTGLPLALLPVCGVG